MFEEAVPRRWQAEIAGSVAASFLLHALLALAATMMWQAPPPAPLEENIPVTLLTPAELDALLHPPSPEPAPREPPAGNRPTTAEPLTHAATILSGLALAQPRNRQAREDLPKLNPTERMIQLCNIEALQQVARVRRNFSPEMVDAHAMKALAILADTVEADGAAVRSGDDWYMLRYRCRLAPDHTAVVAFDFLAGDKLTAERVEELGLAVGR
jgi:hypothetical protein